MTSGQKSTSCSETSTFPNPHNWQRSHRPSGRSSSRPPFRTAWPMPWKSPLWILWAGQELWSWTRIHDVLRPLWDLRPITSDFRASPFQVFSKPGNNASWSNIGPNAWPNASGRVWPTARHPWWSWSRLSRHSTHGDGFGPNPRKRCKPCRREPANGTWSPSFSTPRPGQKPRPCCWQKTKVTGCS